jgi:hypothetical protein
MTTHNFPSNSLSYGTLWNAITVLCDQCFLLSYETMVLFCRLSMFKCALYTMSFQGTMLTCSNSILTCQTIMMT